MNLESISGSTATGAIQTALFRNRSKLDPGTTNATQTPG